MSAEPALQGSRLFGPGRKMLLMTLLFCIIGCLWVWKESLYERTAEKLLALETRERELHTARGYLNQQLLTVAEYSRVTRLAGRQLGMVLPRSAPDTIWCPDEQPELQLGSMALYTLPLPGMLP